MQIILSRIAGAFPSVPGATPGAKNRPWIAARPCGSGGSGGSTREGPSGLKLHPLPQAQGRAPKSASRALSSMFSPIPGGQMLARSCRDGLPTTTEPPPPGHAPGAQLQRFQLPRYS